MHKPNLGDAMRDTEGEGIVEGSGARIEDAEAEFESELESYEPSDNAHNVGSTTSRKPQSKSSPARPGREEADCERRPNGFGVLGAVVVMAGGFTVARAMRFRRFKEDDERRQSEALNRHRHHIRGSL